MLVIGQVSVKYLIRFTAVGICWSLQVHAAAGNFEAALESVFNTASDTGSAAPGSAAAAAAISSSVDLEAAMETADAVLRLAEDSRHIAGIG